MSVFHVSSDRIYTKMQPLVERVMHYSDQPMYRSSVLTHVVYTKRNDIYGNLSDTLHNTLPLAMDCQPQRVTENRGRGKLFNGNMS